MNIVEKNSPTGVPFRTVLLSIAVLWLTYFVIATLRWEIIAAKQAVEMMQLRAIVTLAGMVITLVLWSLIRLFDSRALWIKATAALILAMPISILLAHVNGYVFSDINAHFEAEYAEEYRDTSGDIFMDVKPYPDGVDRGNIGSMERDPLEKGAAAKENVGGLIGYLRPLTEIAFSRYFMLLAWASLYFSLLAVSQVRAAERREQKFRNAAKASELRSLRYQVNPHFLFNTLNSLSALVMTGKPDRAEQMIQTISNFYRHSLADDPTSDVTLADEIDLQRLYLTIEAVRFPERLVSTFDIPHDLEEARVPGMILQPLVENSVKYAVSAVTTPVSINIAAREEFDRLVISVSDDGPGLPEGSEHGFGIGLANVRDRLEARFGPDVLLTSGPVPGGYKSEIRIPLTRNG
ncbi:MAG: histidine kinase [Erythrobacter sp.]